VTGVGFAPDGKTLVSVSAASKHISMWEKQPQMSDRPGQLKLWDLAERKERASQTHPRGLWSIAHSPDGKVLAGVAGPFGEIDLWDARLGRPRAILAGHRAAATRVEFLSEGKTLASIGDDATLRLWDVEVPAEPHVVYDGGLDRGNTVFMPGSNSIVTARQG